MDKIIEQLKGPVFAGFVRALVACMAGVAVKHGIDMGSYVEPITGGIVMLLVMWWSKKDKRGRKTEGRGRRSEAGSPGKRQCINDKIAL